MLPFRLLVPLGLVSLLGTPAIAQTDTELSPGCQVICEFGRDFQKRDCGCPLETMSGGAEQPPGTMPLETPIQLDEVLEEVEYHYLWSIEGVDNYQSVEESNIAPVPTPIYREKEVVNGEPRMRQLNLDELNQRALSQTPGAEDIANVDPAEYLALLARAAEFVQEEGRDEPSLAPIFNNPKVDQVIAELKGAAGDYDTFQEEQFERTVADTLHGLSFEEKALFWDHESMTMGTGVYRPEQAAEHNRFEVKCREVGKFLIQVCLEAILENNDDASLGPGIGSIILRSEPNIDWTLPLTQQEYKILYAEKWVEAERFLAKRGQYLDNVDGYQGARAIRTKFKIQTLGENGFEQMTVERVTDEYKKTGPLEVATRVRDRVTQGGVATPEVRKLITVKKVNEGPPTLQEMAEDIGARVGVPGAMPGGTDE